MPTWLIFSRLAAMVCGPSINHDRIRKGTGGIKAPHTTRPSISTLPAVLTTILPAAQLSAATNVSTKPSTDIDPGAAPSSISTSPATATAMPNTLGQRKPPPSNTAATSNGKQTRNYKRSEERREG